MNFTSCMPIKAFTVDLDISHVVSSEERKVSKEEEE